MTIKCCVSNCPKTNAIKHRFPANTELCDEWLKAVNQQELFLNRNKLKNYRICDLHFTESDKFLDCRNRSNLKKRAIPSINLKSLQSIQMEEEEISLNNIENICRTCLNLVDSKSLFPAFTLKYNNSNFVEILRLCTGVQIDQNEKLPLQLCKGCISETTRSFEFRIRCEQSDARLKRIFIQTFPESETVIKPEKEIEEIWLDTFVPNDETGEEEEEEEKNKDSEPSSSKLDEISPKKEAQQEKKKSLKHGTLPLVCCGKTFETRIEYFQHKKEKEHPRKLKNLICTVCNRSCPSNFKLMQHMRVHTKEQPFQCQVCQKRFSVNQNLRRHMVSHTGEKPYMCEICGKGFTQPSNLKEHKNIHKGEMPFLCNQCGKRFRQSSSLKMHEKAHLRGKLRERSINSTQGNKLYKKEKNSDRGTFYSCIVCNKQFSAYASVVSHTRVHSGERPYVCSECGQAFRQINHLKHHQRTHSGEKPYKCSVCGKGFALNGNLTVHMRTHTREMTFLCSLCDKTFYEPRSLKRHEKRTHGVIKAMAESTREKTIAESSREEAVADRS